MNPIEFFCPTCCQAKYDYCVDLRTHEPFPIKMFHLKRIEAAGRVPVSHILADEINKGCPQAFNLGRKF